MDMNQLISHMQSMAVLYAEILLCIAAASILGWIAGWMMQRSKSHRQLARTTQLWEERYRKLEDTARHDAENLEEQLQSIANETKTLQATNRTLTETLKKHDTNNQKARAESIELNRQHTETHDRLQRIIQHKDREILELGNRLNIDPQPEPRQGSTHSTSKIAAASRRNAPAAIFSLTEDDLDNADTVAISPAQFGNDALDATVQMDLPSSLATSASKAHPLASHDADESLDDTSDLSGVGIEESTIAMDDEALAFAQRSYKSRSND